MLHHQAQEKDAHLLGHTLIVVTKAPEWRGATEKWLKLLFASQVIVEMSPPKPKHG